MEYLVLITKKKGSFYTVKEIWSPVHFKETAINSEFNGKLEVANRYLYTNLNQCKYSFELVKYEKTFPRFETVKKSGNIQPPDIAPGESGLLNLNLPPGWKTYDVLYVTATDQYGRPVNTWSWNITKPKDFISRLVKTNQDKVTATEHDSILVLSSGKTEITFNKKTGLITGVQNNSKAISFSNGIQFAGFTAIFKQMKHYALDNKQVVELIYDSPCHTKFTMLPGGWLQLDYDYQHNGLYGLCRNNFLVPRNPC